jgi:hypothetical protein
MTTQQIFFRTSRRFAAIAALILALIAPMAALADSSVQGTVVDPTDASIVGARVSATLIATGMTRVTMTDAMGQFRIPSLPIGTYTIRCEKDGFQTVEIQQLSLSIGQALDQRIEMKIAQHSEDVEVREQPEALETTAITGSVALGGERIDENPTQNRNYLNYVLMVPGVAASANSNALLATAAMRSASPDSGFSFSGMRGRNNGLSIDGLDNRDETTGGNRVAVGLEMVQEFRVSSTNIAPEFGGAAGGNLNVVTLSGTNRWHGDANLFVGDDVFNARDPEVETGAKPRFRSYQPGVSLNGPIQKDRTFFSTSLEGEYEFGQDFSEANGATVLINAALQLPEFSRAGTRQISETLFPSSSSSTEFSFRVDHHLNSRNELSAKYALSLGRVSHEVLGTDNFSEQSSRGSSLNHDQSFAASWQAVPTSTFANDLRVQFARRTVDLTPNARGALIEIPGVVSLGQSWQLDASRTEDHYQIVESATLVHGSHQFGFGVSGQLVHLHARLADQFGGIYIFPTVEDFVRGMPDVFLQAFGDPRTAYNTMPVGVWMQDQWQPITGLTVIGGIRYDAQKLPSPFPSATQNWAPRLGFAWHPAGKGPWVFQAGFGLFFDRYPFGFLNSVIQKDGIHAFEQYVTGAAAVQAFAVGQGGTLLAPLPGVARSVYRPDPYFPSTYSRQFTAGVERSLGADTTLSVEYSNVHGFHLPRVRNANLVLPPQYQLEQTSRSSYQGVSVSLNRRLAKELTYLIGYTWGSAWDDASDYYEQPLNPANMRLDWARSLQYQAHRIVGSSIFELPWEDSLTAPRWFRSLSNRVEFGPIVTFGSPQPVNALESSDVFRTGAYPISARPFGLGRNPFDESSVFSLDLRVTKGFELWKDHGLTIFGVDAYNLTNHTNALRVSPYYSSRGVLLSTYRGLVETLGARQIQFSVQWEF